MLGDRKHLWDFFRRIQLYALKEGGVCKVSLGPHTVYVICDPEDSLKLSNICLNKPYLYDFMEALGKNGLVTAEASIWKRHRKLLNPAFNQQVLNTYVNEINVQARTLVSQLAPKVGKEPFDVRHYIVNYILAIITRTLIGLSTNDHLGIGTDYTQAIDDLLILYSNRIQKIWLHLSYIYKWSALKRRENQLLDKVKDIINPIIRKRKSELITNNVPDINSETTSTSGRFEPVVDQMLQLAEERNAFTDDDIGQHLHTLVAASYDTTSNAMAFILLVIGSYQNVQKRIFDELQEVFGHDDTDVTKQDLQKLVYLEAVIKESMRLYPVVPIIARKVDVEVNLSKLFSMMVMKVALVHIIRRYRVTGDINNVECEFDIVLKPMKGHHICLKART
ncbi:hypothetical protein PYW07_010029 [Mythimna separata]|uniref:Cytochrome P450 n=1 Tax=Mythimna separata TaxID=271217 RepID=A0AAD8DQ70_MYTSE|nr:hypothetical protein PYW07_010029 [Mythimna separata]